LDVFEFVKKKNNYFHGSGISVIGNSGYLSLNSGLVLRNNNQPADIAFKIKISVPSRSQV